jgi:hypothetical protein
LLFNHISLHNSCWNWTFLKLNILCAYISFAGTGIAISGVFLYSRVNRIKPKTD